MINQFRILPRPQYSQITENSGIRLNKLLIIYHNKLKIKDHALLISNIFYRHLGTYLNTEPIKDTYLDSKLGEKYFLACISTEDNYDNVIKNKMNEILTDNFQNSRNILTGIKEGYGNDNDFPNFNDDFDEAFRNEGYFIEIKNESIWIISETQRGFYYGIQTLIQIINQVTIMQDSLEEYIKIPESTILDFPSFQFRGFHLDLKEQMPTMDFLREFIPFLGKYKYNKIIVEYGDKFNYKGLLNPGFHKYVLRDNDLEELKSLCNLNFLEIVPLIQVFGHLERWLSLPEFKNIQEINEWSLCPLKEESIEFMNEMVDQISKAHPDSKYIHIGGDDVYQLGTCNECKEFIEQYSKSELYIDYINKVAERVISNGKTPIIWSDYLIKYPEALDKLNKKIIIMYGDYIAPLQRKNETATILPFYEFFRGESFDVFNVIGAPSSASEFKLILPDYYRGINNITLHSARTLESHSFGILITSWAECGDPLDTQIPVILFGSDPIWNPNRTDFEIKSPLKNFEFNWEYYSEAALLHLFEVDPVLTKLNFNRVFQATHYPDDLKTNTEENKEEVILQILSNIDVSLEELDNLLEEAYNNEIIVESMILGLKTRKFEMDSLKALNSLKILLINYDNMEDPSIFTDENLSEISQTFQIAEKQFKKLERNANKLYVNGNRVKPGELDQIFNDKKHFSIDLFNTTIPSIMDLLLQLSEKSKALKSVKEQGTSDKSEDVSELKEYKELEDILVNLSRHIFFN